MSLLRLAAAVILAALSAAAEAAVGVVTAGLLQAVAVVVAIFAAPALFLLSQDLKKTFGVHRQRGLVDAGGALRNLN